MSTFGAKPEILIAKGNELAEKSREFRENGKKIFDTVEEMITSNYSSPEAVAIANEIRSYQDDLENMQMAITNYSEFCKIAGNKVVRNQENIISSIK